MLFIILVGFIIIIVVALMITLSAPFVCPYCGSTDISIQQSANDTYRAYCKVFNKTWIGNKPN